MSNLDHRSRDENGEIRRKRGDTLIRTIEKEYGIDLDVRSDMRLDTYLRRTRIDSLSNLLHKN